MAERPTFLSIIAILLAIYGVLLIIGGLAMVAMSGNAEIQKIFTDAGLNTSWMTALGLLALVLGILAIAVAYLLWKGIKLGWFLALIFLVFNLVYGLLAGGIGWLALIITVLLIIYFLRPKVRAFFGT